MNASLFVDSITVRRGGRVIISDFSTDIDASERVALMGRSGCGKTTILRAILGLEPVASGSIRIGSAEVTRGDVQLIPPENRGLSMVFQDLALWPHMSVLRQLTFVLGAGGVERSAREARAKGMLERLGLLQFMDRLPGDLSGGERQRVALARALVVNPKAILLDEPLTHLDPELHSECLALMKLQFDELRPTVLYVTHDVNEAKSLGCRIQIINNSPH